MSGEHIHLDLVGGIAGDMFVAALLDARPDLCDRVFGDLAAIRPDGRPMPKLSKGTSGGIGALRYGIDAGGYRKTEHAHGHGGAHRHGHRHAHSHDHGHHHGTPFTTLRDLIASTPMQTGTSIQSIAILERLAEAESRIHQVSIQEVHFHEVGDWDSLMDVVAAGSIIAALDGVTWSASSIPLGHGLVKTQHGLLPVPAPATAELMRGFEVRQDGVGGERVTPTGAAILAHLKPRIVKQPSYVLTGVGTGAGTRELDGMPNILRALLYTGCRPVVGDYRDADEIILVSFDVDDMTGEEIGIAVERLRSQDGVLDISLGNRQGKKGRPVVDFSLLVRPDLLNEISERCFHETSTIGLRWRRESRICLSRHEDHVEVGGKLLRRKISRRPYGTASIKTESDDVASLEGLANRRGVRAESEIAKEHS